MILQRKRSLCIPFILNICQRSHSRSFDCRRYAEPTFEEEEEVIDGDFSGSMYGLVDNDKEPSKKASKLDKALLKVKKVLDKQMAQAGLDTELSSEVDVALSQVSGLASRLFSSAEELAKPASA
jgi:hypothetical protein